MYAQTQHGNLHKAYYRCVGKMSGFKCEQGGIRVTKIDGQVLIILANLRPPKEWRTKILSTISDLLGEQQLEQRLVEIKQTIDRMDFRWDHGFISDKEEYLEKQVQLQQELERLNPAQEDLEAAVDVQEHFEERLAACHGDVEKQH